MRRDSSARLVANLLSYLAGAVAAVITARWLGPSDKGIVALITLLSGLLTRCAVVSLGEAAVVLVGKGTAKREHAIGTVIATCSATSVAAMIAFAGLAALLLDPTTSSIWLAIGLGAVSIPLLVFSDVLSQFLLIERRVVRASVVFATGSVVTLLSIAILLIPLGFGVAGAVAGTAIGGIASLAAAVRVELLSRPRVDRTLLRRALAYGVPAESGILLTQAAARLDLLLVFAIAGSSAAGIYSVALTIGALVSLAPGAIAFAAFPRLARAQSGPEATVTVAKLTRLATASAIVSSLIIAAGTVITLTPLFGEEFSAALTPALILLAAGVPWGMQWTLARAHAALGDPKLLFGSFGIAVAVMATLDLILIPLLNLNGAALASAIGTAVGTLVCVRHVNREGVAFRSLLPRVSEIAALRHPGRIEPDPELTRAVSD